jgi:hypothetical protein
LIFLAAGLVLPIGQGTYPSDLQVYFHQGGRWAVAAVAVRGLVAIMGNFELRGLGILIFSQSIIALLFLISKQRKYQIAFTLLYGLVFFLTAAFIYATY